ncbi:MAG: PAS domain-containing protein [Deltaproteobacteria bacterium]|nr:PAS domain-containing protein [Deltaproteobacteria bacterium]
MDQYLLFKSIADNSPAVIGAKDLDGRYIYVNKEYSRLFNLPFDAFIGKSDSELFPVEIANKFREADIDVQKSLRSIMIEENALVRGEIRKFMSLKFPIMDKLGHLYATGIIATDITERTQAGKELKNINEKYRHSLDLMHYVISHARSAIAVHDKDLNYIYVSDRYLEEYGVKGEKVIGRHHYEVFPDLPQKWRDVHQRCLKGEVLSAEEDPYARDDGTVEWTRWECRPWYENDESIGGIIVYTEVITDRKRQEEERLKLQNQLQQAQKMESVGRLAGGVAHDFNNMLGAIIGHAELASLEVDSTSPTFAHLQEILKAAQKSSGLTKQLLAFARKQTVRPRVIDLNQTILQMIKMLQRLIGEEIELKWLPSEDLWSIKIDPTQVDQILANLAVNAHDAIEGTGVLTIETANTYLDKSCFSRQTGFMPGEFVQLTVTDTGSGMDQETQKHLFEPFFTTKEMGKGTGLGLATIDGIIKQNKGIIEVYSELDHGTCFKIYFPRFQGVVDLEKSVSEDKVICGKGETLLLVEDDPILIKMSQAMLKKLGYRVLAAESPTKAIRLAKENLGKIDLLLTDVVMPEMNGRELVENLVKIHPDLKWIYMSGYTADIISRHGVLQEGVFFLEKPFSKNNLSCLIHHVLTH